MVTSSEGSATVVATAATSASLSTAFVEVGVVMTNQMTIAARVVATKAWRPCEPCAHFALCRMGCSTSRYEAMLRASVIAMRIAVRVRPSTSNRSLVQKMKTGQCQRYNAYERRPMYASGRQEKTTDKLLLNDAIRTASKADAIE